MRAKTTLGALATGYSCSRTWRVGVRTWWQIVSISWLDARGLAACSCARLSRKKVKKQSTRTLKQDSHPQVGIVGALVEVDVKELCRTTFRLRGARPTSLCLCLCLCLLNTSALNPQHAATA
jgi:hypothetical protein